MTQLLLIWLLSFSVIVYSSQENVVEDTEYTFGEEDLFQEELVEDIKETEEIGEALPAQENVFEDTEYTFGEEDLLQSELVEDVKEDEEIVEDIPELMPSNVFDNEETSQEVEIVKDEQIDFDQDVFAVEDMPVEELKEDVAQEEETLIDKSVIEDKIVSDDEILKSEISLQIDEQEDTVDVVVPSDQELTQPVEPGISDSLMVDEEFISLEDDMSISKEDDESFDKQLTDEEDEIKGITTVDLDEPRGNWLFKRIWWERSEGRYDKIRELLNGINETRVHFFTQSIDLDKKVLDPFYLEINYERGMLYTLLEELEQKLNQERIEDGMLDVQEREVLDKVKEEKTMLLQLQEDVKSILAMDNKVNDVLGRVMDQITRANKYEHDAWESMKEIARILDDIQARDLYYKVDTSWRNTKEVSRYLEIDLKRHFDELVSTTTEQIDRIKKTLSLLQERGSLLKQEVQAIDDYENMIESQEIIDFEDEEPIVKQPTGWFGNIWQWLTSWF
jgi:hypothetical protein